MSLDISIPTPQTLEQATWFVIGFLFARAFGKKLDYELQDTEWFKKQHGLVQWIIKRSLDFLHHFWIGLLIVLYAEQLVGFIGLADPAPLIWFAYGLILDDLPDIPARFQAYFKYFFH